MDCLFCKISRGEIPADVIYEDERVLVFLDIHPIAPGHTMVIPKRHAENILDLGKEDIGPIFEAVKKLTGVLNNALNPQGFTIGINHGKVSGQTIDHLHVHIIPRFDEDGGGSLHSVVNNPPEMPLKEIKKKILEIINDGSIG